MWRTCAALVAVVVAPLTACAPGDGGGPQVVASFYPLQYVAERIVGPHASVTDLTAPGVEPHDLELSPRQVARISAARAVFYEKGLQPAVDDAVRNNGPDEVVDAAAVVPLRSGEGGMDPHFWLDPTLLARAAAGFTDAVVRADPSHAADYRKNLAALEADLATLDRDLAQGLAHCRTRTVVVSHDAFEYLGRRYGLDVQPIAGLSPDAEPSARKLAQLADLAHENSVTTVFTETLASRKLAQTLADDAGITTAVLDPVEGLASSDGDADYLSLMRGNLAALRKAGGCS